MAEKARRNRIAALAVLSAIAGLCSFQYGDKYNLNSMRFSQVAQLTSDLPRAREMARQGNIELLAGKAVAGKAVHWRGELTDANCFFASHEHAYDHAFCAKLCVAAGSPIVFLPDQGEQLYFVLTARNGVRIPDSVLDKIGVPGIVISGKLMSAGTLTALAVDRIERQIANSKHQ